MPLAPALSDLARRARRLVQQALQVEVRTRQDAEDGVLVARSTLDPATGGALLVEEGPASPGDPAARAHHGALAAAHGRQLRALTELISGGEGSGEAG